MTAKKQNTQKNKSIAEYHVQESQFHIDIKQIEKGKKVVCIYGVKRIMTYSETQMAFFCKGKILVTIEGALLQCQAYMNGMIEVAGQISQISFDGGEI